jgi:hypothetical protein
LKDGQKKNTTDDNENRSATNCNFRNSANKIVEIQMQDKAKQRRTKKRTKQQNHDAKHDTEGERDTDDATKRHHEKVVVPLWMRLG